MKQVTVAYPSKHNAKFDFDYHMRKHIPTVSRLWGQALKSVRGVTSSGLCKYGEGAGFPAA
jgi:hypothetical protein